MNKILFVDDEYEVLSAYRRNFGRYFQVITAISGEEALEKLNETLDISLVITDYKMPVMDGIVLLKKIQEIFPDIMRIMITGHADLQTTIEAVNKGNIYRFLTKPVDSSDLLKIIYDAVELYDLKKSEKVLLNKTLRGIINILLEIQSSIHPQAINQINKVREYGKRISEILKYDNNWEFDISLMLSKIGYLSITQDIIEKMALGIDLKRDEKKLFNMHPEFGASLIKRIPRLEKIAISIEYQNVNYDGSNNKKESLKGSDLPFVSRVLRLINDFGEYLSKGMSEKEAFQNILSEPSHYDPDMLSALNLIIKGNKPVNTVISIKFKDLRIGMIVAKDVRDLQGNLLIRKGVEITDVILMKMIHISKVREISEPLFVILKK